MFKGLTKISKERVLCCWNSLDAETVTSETINCFKYRLKRIRELKRSLYKDWQFYKL
jgi:hypothetical protein